MDFYSLLFYIFTFFISYTLTQTLLHRFQNLPPFPFPTAPITGHIRYLFKFPNSVHRTLAARAARYGPILSLHLGSRPALLVSSPSAAEECLAQNDAVFANRPRFLRGKILGYDYTTVLWAPYGPLWRAHRRIMAAEILSLHRLQLLSWVRADEVRELIRRVVRLSDDDGNRTVEIRAEVSALTNNVMMRMIAGKRWETTSSEVGKRLREVVEELAELGGGVATAADFVPVFRWLGLFRRRERRLEGVSGKMDGIFQDLVDEKRKEMIEGTAATASESKSLIEVLLELQKSDPTNYTSDTMVKGLVQTLLLTGSESSASTIEWTLSLLINNHQVLIKAQQEIDSLLGSCNRLLEEIDLNSLPYLHCIIKESLRMYPVAPLLTPHESSADCVVGGYHIPRGTMLIVNAWAIHNDPKIWNEPRVFKPERFLNLEDEHKLGYKFMPFGSGKRACPGEKLAMRMVALAVGSLIQCFDLKRVGEEMVDMKEKLGVFMWKANPLQLRCSPRKEILTKFI